MIKTQTGQELSYFVHKYEVQQVYGGPEEGGWWYDSGVPVPNWVSIGFENEEDAFAYCRMCNEQEYERQKSECRYEYTSVLSYREEFYMFDVNEDPVAKPFPEHRPHYE